MGITEYRAENKSLKEKVADLTAQVVELNRLIYGSKHERHIPEVNPQQLPLFGEIIEPPKEIPEEEKKEATSKRKKKKHPGRNSFPDHLPVEEIVIEPEIDTTEMNRIGQDVVDTLDYTPGKLKIIRRIYPKYTIKEGDGVFRGAVPVRPIEKGIAEPGLLAHIFTQKFVWHIPFYRTLTQFKQLDQVDIAKSSVNSWFISVCTLMEPLYECIKRRVFESTYIQADESPIKVLDRDKKRSSHQGYQWVYHCPESGYVLFDYRKGRGQNGPRSLLEAYEGFLQADGYAVYDSIADKNPAIALAGCMAHARRYFFKAKDNDPKRANHALKVFKQLYTIEREAKEANLSPDLTRQKREEESEPILKEFLEWAIQEKAKTTPTSRIGKAFTYLTNQWPKLITYLEDGRILIDNNLIENSIRPLALGRKNYLFAGSHNAGRRIAMMYSFFATCKMHGVNPYVWLREVLKKLPEHPINRVEELLPGDWVKEIEMQLPENLSNSGF